LAAAIQERRQLEPPPGSSGASSASCVYTLFGLLALAGFGHHGLHEQAIGPRGPSSRASARSAASAAPLRSPTIWATRLAHAAGSGCRGSAFAAPANAARAAANSPAS
jgi:hypothetical protein